MIGIWALKSFAMLVLNSIYVLMSCPDLARFEIDVHAQLNEGWSGLDWVQICLRAAILVA